MKKVVNSAIIGIIVLVIIVAGSAIAYYGFSYKIGVYYSPVSCSLTDYIKSDYDNDGISALCNADGSGNDNCPTISNSNQQDSDRDGVGDACNACAGTNRDRDSYCDDVDPSPYVAKNYKAVAFPSPSPTYSPSPYASSSPYGY